MAKRSLLSERPISLFLFIWYIYELFQGLFYFKNEIRMEEILQNCNFDVCRCITQLQYCKA